MRKSAEAFGSIAERLRDNKKSNGKARAKEVKEVEEVKEVVKEGKEGYPPGVFCKNVIPGEFKSFAFVRVANTGLTGAFFVRMHSKGLSGSRAWRSGLWTPGESTGLPKPELEARGWKSECRDERSGASDQDH